MPVNGEVTVIFRVYSSSGPDLLLTRAEALRLLEQLSFALRTTKQPKPAPAKP